jgi:hypothetical protein
MGASHAATVCHHNVGRCPKCDTTQVLQDDHSKRVVSDRCSGRRAVVAKDLEFVDVAVARHLTPG